MDFEHEALLLTDAIKCLTKTQFCCFLSLLQLENKPSAEILRRPTSRLVRGPRDVHWSTFLDPNRPKPNIEQIEPNPTHEFWDSPDLTQPDPN